MDGQVIQFDHFRRRVEQIDPESLTTVRLGPGKKIWVFDDGGSMVIADAEDPPQWVLAQEAAERSRDAS